LIPTYVGISRLLATNHKKLKTRHRRATATTHNSSHAQQFNAQPLQSYHRLSIIHSDYLLRAVFSEVESRPIQKDSQKIEHFPFHQYNPKCASKNVTSAPPRATPATE